MTHGHKYASVRVFSKLNLSPLLFSSLPLSPFCPPYFFLLRANNTKTTFLKCNPPVDVLETFPIPSPLLSVLAALSLSLSISLLSSGKSAYCIIMWDDLKNVLKSQSNYKIP